MINISVLVVTLNEAENLPRCLNALERFDEVIVIESGNDDNTEQIVQSFGVRFEKFNWNGEYPKKRQWCLDNLEIKNDFVFFVDADEVITPDLIDEISSLPLDRAGYFVRGNYVWDDQLLNFGLKNNKLALFNRHKIVFPEIDDLDMDSMGEVEGHYQPVLKEGFENQSFGQLKAPLHHYACDMWQVWQARHERYAEWEALMMARNAYPPDPVAGRQFIKKLFRFLPLRPYAAFIHCYVLKGGFLDGGAGWDFAVSRWRYYQMVTRVLATNKAAGKSSVKNTAHSAL